MLPVHVHLPKGRADATTSPGYWLPAFDLAPFIPSSLPSTSRPGALEGAGFQQAIDDESIRPKTPHLAIWRASERLDNDRLRRCQPDLMVSQRVVATSGRMGRSEYLDVVDTRLSRAGVGDGVMAVGLIVLPGQIGAGRIAV